MAVGASATELVEQGLLQDAARLIDQTKDPAQELLVLRTRLESYIGAPNRASVDAHRLLQKQLQSRERSTCWEVIARAAMITGRVAEGLRAMNKALAASAEIQDARQEARLIAVSVASLLQSVDIESATLEMTRLRRSALRAGDAFSLIEYHSLEAEIRIKLGLLASALSTINTARQLLERSPNVAQKGRLAVLASGVAILQGDYDGATKDASEALMCGRTSGLRTVLLPALNNLVYAKMCQRNFAGIEADLDEFLTAVQKGGPTEIGARDTQMMFELASDDLESATKIAKQISDLMTPYDTHNLYYVLWHLPTRIRWLYRIGEIREGIELALASLPRAERERDRQLAARFRILAADGLAREGDHAKANQLLREAVCRDAEPTLELVAEGFRVAGRLTAADNQRASRSYFERATAIFGGLGNLSAQSDVYRDAQESLAAHSEQQEAPRGNAQNMDASMRSACSVLAGVTERLGAFVELGTHLPSLGSEALRMVADTGVAYHCELSAMNAHGVRETLAAYAAPDCPNNPDVQAEGIELGTHRERRYQLSYLPRPETTARMTLISVERLVRSALAVNAVRQLERERTVVWADNPPEQELGLVCSSDRMNDLIKTIRRVAGSTATVLLTGETGVGKEVFARAVHQASLRSDRVFLPFNCSTVPREMFDSQLFGHKRGSFTGAIGDSLGVIRSAASGTLFLDEIGEMAVETQPKLLRFLESGEILPLGETKPQLVDVRIVAATNANLDQLVADGRFREDLYYRLNVIRINIPPLRERREEIPALVEHFLERCGRELQKPLLRIADETLEYLVLYRWPGNVRQLHNEIRRLVAMAEPGSVIMPAHLADDIASSRRTVPAKTSPRLFNEVVTRIDQPLNAAVEHIERATIQRALSMTDGRLDEAARMLGLSRKGLYLKRQRLNLG